MVRGDRDRHQDLRRPARGVPDAICAALEHALAKAPAARTPTAGAFGHELQDAVRLAGKDPTDMVVAEPGGDGTPPPGTRGGGTGQPGFGSRRVLIAGILALVVLIGGGIGLGLALSGGSKSTATPTTTSNVPQAPDMPTTLAGYRKDGEPTNSIVRVFSGQPTYLTDFPWTMNSCSNAMYTTQWRALTTADLVAAGPTDVHASTTLQSNAVKGIKTGHAGLIVGDSCQEPVFFFAGSSSSDTLVDVAVVTQHWTAAP